MRITGKITKIYPQRTGVGVKTGKPYTVTEVHFTWMDDISQRQGIVRCSTMQDLNMNRLKQAFSKAEYVNAHLDFDIRENWKQPDSYFNEIHIHFPTEFVNTKAAGPASDSATMA